MAEDFYPSPFQLVESKERSKIDIPHVVWFLKESLTYKISKNKSVGFSIDKLDWLQTEIFRSTQSKLLFGIPQVDDSGELMGVLTIIEVDHGEEIIYFDLDSIEEILTSTFNCDPFESIALSSVLIFQFNRYGTVNESINKFLLDSHQGTCVGDKSFYDYVDVDVIEITGGVPSAIIAATIGFVVQCGGGGGTVSPNRGVRIAVQGGTGNVSSNSGTGDILDVNPSDTVSMVNNVDRSLYPCVLEEVNRIVNELQSGGLGAFGDHMREIYGASGIGRLSFAVDATMSAGTLGEASANPDFTNTATSYNSLIRINANIANCTRDQIHATLVHEMMHSYINYWRYQYSGDLENFFDLFPSFDYLSTGGSGYTQRSHETMSQNPYLGRIITAIRARNPRLGLENAVNLAYVGLQDTPAFNNLPADTQNNIGLINMASSCRNTPGDTRVYNLLNC
ncbi:MAG: hypothetical protein AB8H12_20395 [Lewinella sp.]